MLSSFSQLLSDNMVLTIDEGVVLTFVSTLPDSERPKVKPSADPRDSGSVSQQTTLPTSDESEPAECDPRGRGRIIKYKKKSIGS